MYMVLFILVSEKMRDVDKELNIISTNTTPDIGFCKYIHFWLYFMFYFKTTVLIYIGKIWQQYRTRLCGLLIWTLMKIPAKKCAVTCTQPVQVAGEWWRTMGTLQRVASLWQRKCLCYSHLQELACIWRIVWKVVTSKLGTMCLWAFDIWY